jgi:hypothetical protein
MVRDMSFQMKIDDKRWSSFTHTYKRYERPIQIPSGPGKTDFEYKPNYYMRTRDEDAIAKIDDLKDRAIQNSRCFVERRESIRLGCHQLRTKM